MLNSRKLKSGDRICVVYYRGDEIIHPTPSWCIGWIGKVIRINRQSVTVEFEVDEPRRSTVRRYIDQSNIQLVE